jgi:rhodanese-related sulfurtransferase
MKKFLLLPTLSLLFGIAQAGNLLGITPDEVLAMQTKGALVVDVRTPEEWKKTGLIPGSKGLTFFDSTGGYDRDAWFKQLKTLVKSPDQPVILVCVSGRRTALVGKMLATDGGYAQVYHLDKGIRGWSAESKPLAPQ